MQRIPITIIAGGLGSGKTTLIQQLLSTIPDQPCLVIIDKVEGAFIEHTILTSYKSNCNVVLDATASTLSETLWGHHAHLLNYQHIFVEISGFTESTNKVNKLLCDIRLQQYVYLNAFITLVDTEQIWKHLVSVVARLQIALATHVIINKIDRVSSVSLNELKNIITVLNPTAEISCSRYCQIDENIILTKHHIPQLKKSIYMGNFNELEEERSLILTLTNHRPVDGKRFSDWFKLLIKRPDIGISRSKGVLLFMGIQRRFVVQSIYSQIDGHFLEIDIENSHQESQLVLIGRNFNASVLAEEFNACSTPELKLVSPN